MLRHLLLLVAALSIASPAAAQQCLHGRTETSDQKARREKAIRVAQSINAAEVVIVGPQKPKYRRPEELVSVPALPSGFAMEFNLDGGRYSFSIKDTLDACHYAIFSDQNKLVYDGTPLSTTILLPVGTR